MRRIVLVLATMALAILLAGGVALAAHAPIRTNRESPSEGSASEETSILCWCVAVILYSSCCFLWLMRK